MGATVSGWKGSGAGSGAGAETDCTAAYRFSVAEKLAFCPRLAVSIRRKKRVVFRQNTKKVFTNKLMHV